MGRNKSGVISLLKLCEQTKTNYMGVYNNLRKMPEYRTITEEQKKAIFEELDKEVELFKAKFL